MKFELFFALQWLVLASTGTVPRESRQVNSGKCCPCPGELRSNVNPEFDPDIEDMTPSDSTVVNSIITTNDCLRLEPPPPPPPPPPPKPIFHPEVGLASSLLETLKAANEEELQEARLRASKPETLQKPNTLGSAISPSRTATITIKSNPDVKPSSLLGSRLRRPTSLLGSSVSNPSTRTSGLPRLGAQRPGSLGVADSNTASSVTSSNITHGLRSTSGLRPPLLGRANSPISQPSRLGSAIDPAITQPSRLGSAKPVISQSTRLGSAINPAITQPSRLGSAKSVISQSTRLGSAINPAITQQSRLGSAKPVISQSTRLGSAINPAITQPSRLGSAKPVISQSNRLGSSNPTISQPPRLGGAKPAISQSSRLGIANLATSQPPRLGSTKPSISQSTRLGSANPAISQPSRLGSIKAPVSQLARLGSTNSAISTSSRLNSAFLRPAQLSSPLNNANFLDSSSLTKTSSLLQNIGKSLTNGLGSGLSTLQKFGALTGLNGQKPEALEASVNKPTVSSFARQGILGATRLKPNSRLGGLRQATKFDDMVGSASEIDRRVPVSYVKSTPTLTANRLGKPGSITSNIGLLRDGQDLNEDSAVNPLEMILRMKKRLLDVLIGNPNANDDDKSNQNSADIYIDPMDSASTDAVSVSTGPGKSAISSESEESNSDMIVQPDNLTDEDPSLNMSTVPNTLPQNVVKANKPRVLGNKKYVFKQLVKPTSKLENLKSSQSTQAGCVVNTSKEKISKSMIPKTSLTSSLNKFLNPNTIEKESLSVDTPNSNPAILKSDLVLQPDELMDEQNSATKTPTTIKNSFPPQKSLSITQLNGNPNTLSDQLRSDTSKSEILSSDLKSDDEFDESAEKTKLKLVNGQQTQQSSSLKQPNKALTLRERLQKLLQPKPSLSSTTKPEVLRNDITVKPIDSTEQIPEEPLQSTRNMRPVSPTSDDGSSNSEIEPSDLIIQPDDTIDDTTEKSVLKATPTKAPSLKGRLQMLLNPNPLSPISAKASEPEVSKSESIVQSDTLRDVKTHDSAPTLANPIVNTLGDRVNPSRLLGSANCINSQPPSFDSSKSAISQTSDLGSTKSAISQPSRLLGNTNSINSQPPNLDSPKSAISKPPHLLGSAKSAISQPRLLSKTNEGRVRPHLLGSAASTVISKPPRLGNVKSPIKPLKTPSLIASSIDEIRKIEESCPGITKIDSIAEETSLEQRTFDESFGDESDAVEDYRIEPTEIDVVPEQLKSMDDCERCYPKSSELAGAEKIFRCKLICNN